jgi:hypothetical protein
MTGEDIEIAIQRLHIDRVMHDGLRAINKHFRAMLMRQGNNVRYRIFRSQHIGNVSNCQ